MVLNDLELEIVSTKAMRFTEKEAMEHLKENGYDISLRTYYYTLGHISSETRKRAFEIAKSFLEDHINTCAELDNIKKMMYKAAQKLNKKEKSSEEVMVLAKITETMIPYISAYREATQKIIVKVKKEVGNQEKNIDLSALGV